MNNGRQFTAVIITALMSISCMAQTRPNIVMIMADDLGGRDLPVYGNRFNETPNIDKLATQGVRFTSAYAARFVRPPGPAYSRVNIRHGWGYSILSPGIGVLTRR